MLRMTAIPFGILFMLGAALLVSAARGVVPGAPPFTAGDWPWVATVTAIFATFGIGCVLWGLGSDATATILIRCSVAIVAAGFILALNWVAFGPGIRQFGISAAPLGGVVPMDAATNAWAGRTAFGIVAVGLDLIVLAVGASWAVYWSKRGTFTSDRRRRSSPTTHTDKWRHR
jgi:hypothetical protein